MGGGGPLAADPTVNLYTDLNLSQRQFVRRELALLRRLRIDRCSASMCLPPLRRTALQDRGRRPAENGGNKYRCNIQETAMISSPHAPLTTNEEVTLRRVAYGQSDARAMRRHDLARLHELFLIEDSKDGPRLTPAGKLRFDILPKAALWTRPARSTTC